MANFTNRNQILAIQSFPRIIFQVHYMMHRFRSTNVPIRSFQNDAVSLCRPDSLPAGNAFIVIPFQDLRPLSFPCSRMVKFFLFAFRHCAPFLPQCKSPGDAGAFATVVFYEEEKLCFLNCYYSDTIIALGYL